MAVEVLYDVDVSINAVDLSDHGKRAVVTYNAEMLDHTTFGLDTRRNIAGLKDWSIEVDFEQDYAASNVDATLWSLVGAAAFTVTLKPTSGAVGPTNPSFSGSAVLEGHTPINGDIGVIQIITARFVCAGALARATS
jgi:hypothetical protein